METKSKVLLLMLACCVCCEDLYKTLGVSRSATPAEIKKAYNKLAMKWHPDKNRSPEAADMMASINKAYEILSDQNKKARYDLLGEIDEPSHHHQQPYYRSSFTFTTTSSSSSSSRYKFQEKSQLFYPHDEINSQQFVEQFIPNSHTHPHLVYYFHDFCVRCKPFTEKWNDLHKELLDEDIATGSVHVITSSYATSFSDVFIHQVPHVALLLKGIVYHYKEKDLTFKSLKDFINDNLPKTVTEVAKSSFTTSNDSRINNNKPLVMVFTPRTTVSFHLNLLAFKYHKFCQFVFVSTSDTAGNGDVISTFNVKANKTLLIFKEANQPVVRLEDDTLTKESLKGSIEHNKLLQLPRVTSSAVLDAICPVDRTCVLMLVDGPGQYSDHLTSQLRHQSLSGTAYIDTSKQHQFITKFSDPNTGAQQQLYCSDGKLSRVMLVLHRESLRRASYQWHTDYCATPNDNDRIVALLKAPHTSAAFKYTYLDSIVDEDAAQWSPIEFLATYWEKIMAFIALPLPLLVMACYLYIGPHPMPHLQQHNQNVRRLSTRRQQDSLMASNIGSQRRRAISLDNPR